MIYSNYILSLPYLPLFSLTIHFWGKQLEQSPNTIKNLWSHGIMAAVKGQSQERWGKGDRGDRAFSFGGIIRNYY